MTKSILKRNGNLKSLLDNEWIYLLIMDPKDMNKVKKYSRDMIWNYFPPSDSEGLDEKMLQELEIAEAL